MNRAFVGRETTGHHWRLTRAENSDHRAVHPQQRASTDSRVSTDKRVETVKQEFHRRRPELSLRSWGAGVVTCALAGRASSLARHELLQVMLDGTVKSTAAALVLKTTLPYPSLMSNFRGLLMKLRPIVRRAGYDVVTFPGSNPAYLRSKMLSELEVDLVLDVGANTGQYGAGLRKFGYEGQILSFEPLSSAFHELQIRTMADNSWNCVHTALGVDSGELSINIAGNSVSSSLLPMLERHELSAPSSQYVGVETVCVERLDTVAQHVLVESRRPYLKIDTQGYEWQVLDGAPTTLLSVVAIEIELSLTPLYAGQPLLASMLERLAASGFRLAGMAPGFTDMKTGQTLQVDGVFIRD